LSVYRTTTTRTANCGLNGHTDNPTDNVDDRTTTPRRPPGHDDRD
jgi:hypothetical protein